MMAVLLALLGLVIILGVPPGFGERVLKACVGFLILITFAPAAIGWAAQDSTVQGAIRCLGVLLLVSGGLLVAAKLLSGRPQTPQLERPSLRARARLVEPESAPRFKSTLPHVGHGDDLHLFGREDDDAGA